MFPSLLYWLVLPLIPFIVAEQLWPVGDAPRWRDYGTNLLISLSTVYLSLPLGIVAGLLSAHARHLLPWEPVSFTFHNIGAIPIAGPALEILAMIFVPLFLHDFWFYWSHRIEHKVPVLWAFHRLHHSDEHMNTSTWARDHFLQNAWRAFFSVFTLGLIVDLDLTEAGKAALYSNMFLAGLSLFYHSAIRARLPWLDRILVTPQVHRIITPSIRNTTTRISLMPYRFSTSCSGPTIGLARKSSPPPASVRHSQRRARFGQPNLAPWLQSGACCFQGAAFVALNSLSTGVIRWDEKAGLRTGCCTLPSYRRAQGTDKKETGHEEG
jgi:sterol desaturase/sphingolipid hydroxylase (fatty acid hydroxylase superfamily)